MQVTVRQRVSGAAGILCASFATFVHSLLHRGHNAGRAGLDPHSGRHCLTLQDWSSKSGALTGSGVLSGVGSGGMLHSGSRMVGSGGTLDRYSPTAPPPGRLSPVIDGCGPLPDSFAQSSAGLGSRGVSDDFVDR